MTAGWEAILVGMLRTCMRLDIGLENGRERQHADLIGQTIDHLIKRNGGVEGQAQFECLLPIEGSLHAGDGCGITVDRLPL